MTHAPKPFTPTCWPRIERAAAACLAQLARPARRAETRTATLQRRADVAAQAAARETRR